MSSAKCICSVGSPCGRMPCALPDGLMIDLPGRLHAPCQPWSAAGKRGGAADERHLWPEVFRLADKCRPLTIFGEQVASKDGLAWFDLVHADLEGAGYSVGSADLCAAGFGAPHIRQRLYFVADSQHAERRPEFQEDGDTHGRNGLGRSRDLSGGMADPNGRNSSPEGLQRSGQHGQFAEDGCASSSVDNSSDPRRNNSRQRDGGSPLLSARLEQPSGACDLGDTNDTRSQGRLLGRISTDQLPSGTPGLVNGAWREADWIYCRDEKYRPVEAGTFPLAHGVANRVGKLRGYGNAIVAPVAQAFIEAFLETEEILCGITS